jgi:hypothetical protein
LFTDEVFALCRRFWEAFRLLDRCFIVLPIPDYRGRQVDAINNEKVKVEWKITVKM